MNLSWVKVGNGIGSLIFSIQNALFPSGRSFLTFFTSVLALGFVGVNVLGRRKT